MERKNLKSDYTGFSTAETSTTKPPNSQLYFIIPRENSVISLLNRYLEKKIEVLKNADASRYKKGNDIGLFNLSPIALFSIFKLTTSSGKHLEEISHAHIVSLMYKLLTSSRSSDDLSIGFDRDRGQKSRHC